MCHLPGNWDGLHSTYNGNATPSGKRNGPGNITAIMPRLLKQAATPEAEANEKEEDAAVDDGFAPAALAPAEITAEDIVAGSEDSTAPKQDAGTAADATPAAAAVTAGGGGGKIGDAGVVAAAADGSKEAVGPAGADGAQDVGAAAAQQFLQPTGTAAAAAAAPDAATVPTPPAPVPAAPGLLLPLPHTVTLGSKTYVFGISQSALLAPVPVPPKKKPKTQEEFTIHEKLAILAELDDPRMTVPSLAVRHNTSRTSIYRWKRDILRLQKLAGRQGKGEYKRVPHKRKTWNEEYTAAEKLAVVRELKGDDAPSIRELAEKLGTNHRSLYRWRKDEARLVKLVEEEGRGESKRNGPDPLHRVKEALAVFHRECYENPSKGEGRRIITGTIVATKAKQICDEMLREHDASPFLGEEEAKGMRDFRASTSWGRKMVVKMGWNVNPSKNETDEQMMEGKAEAAAQGSSPRGTKRPAAVAGTNAIEAESKNVHTGAKRGPKPTRPAKPLDIKRELALTKKKLHYANWSIKKLEAENRALKERLAAFTGGGEVGAVVENADGQPGGGVAAASPGIADSAPVVNIGGMAAQLVSTMGVEKVDPAPDGVSLERAASAFVESLTAQDEGMAGGLDEGAIMDVGPPGSIEV